MNQNYNYNSQSAVPQMGAAPQTYNIPRAAQYSSYTSQNARIRPVSSVEEVKASSIDFDGSVFYFPDVANKRIYTKFINLDGSVAINLYELKELPAGQPVDSSYVTREEFESAMAQIKAMYQSQAVPAKEETSPIFQF